MYDAKEPSQQNSPSVVSPSTEPGPKRQLRVTGKTSPSRGS